MRKVYASNRFVFDRVMKKNLMGFLSLCLAFSVQGQNIDSYRTRTGGDWASASTWQRFDGSDWANATTYPTSGVDSVFILGGHAVTLSTGMFIDQVKIKSSGTLTIQNVNPALGGGQAVICENGGTLNINNVTLAGSGSILCESGGNMTLSNFRFNGITITNNGNCSWTTGDLAMEWSFFNNNGLFTINSNGTIVGIQNSQNYFYNLADGTINKNSSGETNFASAYNGYLQCNNAGALNINVGTAIFNCQYSNSGPLSVASGARIKWLGPTFYPFNDVFFQTGSSISGAGNFDIENGHVYFNTPISFSSLNLNLTSGTLGGSASVTMQTGSTFNWSGGTIESVSSQALNIDFGATFNTLGSAHIFSGPRTINNYGTWNWTAGNIHANGAAIINNYGTQNIYTSVNMVAINFTTIEYNNQPGGVINKMGADVTVFGSNNGNWLTFNNYGSVNITAGTLSIDAGPGIHSGNYNIAAGATLAGVQALPFSGSSFINNGSVTLNALQFSGNSNQTLSGTGNINSLSINKSAGHLMLGGNQTINNNLSFYQGKMVLGNYDLKMATGSTLNGGSSTAYCIAEGSGNFIRNVQNNAANVLFPVGTSFNYHPVNIQLSAGSTADDFQVRMLNHLYLSYDASFGASGNEVTNGAVDRSWIINEAIPGGSTASISVQWSLSIAEELPGFNRSACRLSSYANGAWSVGPSTNAGVAPYTVLRNGLTTFGAFGVVSNFITCTSSFSQTCAGNGALDIPYTAYGTYNAGNIFTAYLTRLSGNVLPIILGSVNAAMSGHIYAPIPFQIQTNTDYRVYIMSSDPEVRSPDNGSDIDIIKATPYYIDDDLDGFGLAASIQFTCDDYIPSGYVTNDNDCNDQSFYEHPGQIWYTDADGDHYGSGSSVTQCFRPTNGFAASELISTSGDCDDGNSNAHILNNYYVDSDNDGYGSGSPVQFCIPPAAGYSLNNSDCNDNNNAVHPGANEVCNGVDDDCDGSVDDGLTLAYYYSDADGDGYGSGLVGGFCSRPSGGFLVSELITISGDCNDADSTVHPGAGEICDQKDNDCNGLVDEGLLQIKYYRDQDGDGYGNRFIDSLCCIQPAGYVSNHFDCNDLNSAIHPGAEETCNGIDDDCNSLRDETFKWAINAGGLKINGVTTDNLGNHYFIGSYNHQVDFDPGPGSFYNGVSSSVIMSPNIFISKLSANGDFIWARFIGSYGTDEGNAIALDNNGNIYATGHFAGTVDFDPGLSTFNLTNDNGMTAFRLKLNADGEFVWAQKVNVAVIDRNSSGTSISCDKDGNVFYAISSEAGLILMKKGPDDHHLWSHNFGGRIYDKIHASSVDDSGNVVVIAHDFTGTTDFDGVSILKLDRNGNLIWTKKSNASANRNAFTIDNVEVPMLSIKTDRHGNVYTSGSFSGSRDFDPGSQTYNLTAIGNPDIFIQKLNPAGNFLWAKRIGDINTSLPQFARGLDLDTAGNIFITGTLEGLVDMDPNAGVMIASVQSSRKAAFVSKYDESGNYVWHKKFGDGDAGGTKISIDQNGNVLSVGYIKASGDFAPGVANFNLSPNNTSFTDMYVHKMYPPFDKRWYADTDHDGFGNNAVSILFCTQLPNYVMNDEDCNDDDSTIYPGAAEVCNGRDDDCNGIIDDGLGVTVANAGIDIHTCIPSANLSANTALSGSGFWSVISGSGNFEAMADPHTAVNNLNHGANVFRWMIEGSTCSTFDDVTVTLHDGPEASFVNFTQLSYCLGSGVHFSVSANADSGLYSIIATNGSQTITRFLSGLSSTEAFYFAANLPGTVNYRVTVTDIYGCSIVIEQLVMVTSFTQAPATPAAISGLTNPCAFVGSSELITYTVSQVLNAPGYEWLLPPLITLISASPDSSSINVRFEAGFELSANKTLKARAVSPCGKSVYRSLVLTTTKPSTPGVISGPVNSCRFIGSSTKALYTISRVPNTSSYLWRIPAGAIVEHVNTSGPNDTAIRITYTSAIAAQDTIGVKAISACGTSAEKILLVKKILPSTPGTISGNISVCAYVVSPSNPSGIPQTYTIRKVANATSYDWEIPANTSAQHPAGFGENDTIVVLTFNSAFTSGILSVGSGNGCGSNNAKKSITISSAAPAKPGTITSSASDICPYVGSAAGVTYSIRKVAGATGYLWTSPLGSTIRNHSPGINDTAITVDYSASFISGSVNVTAIANCGSSLARSFTVNSLKVGTVSTIVGPLKPCTNVLAKYTIRKVTYATSYDWQVPSGVFISSRPNYPGVNDTVIFVYVNEQLITGSLITVRALNNCSVSAKRTLALTKTIPTQPGSVVTMNIISSCPNRVIEYSVGNISTEVVSYSWILPPYATIVAADPTYQVVQINWGTGAIADSIFVLANNFCGTSLVRSKFVGLPACSQANPEFPKQLLANHGIQIKIYPNPSNHDFKLECLCPRKEEIRLRVFDLHGKLITEKTIHSFEKFTFGKEFRPGMYIAEVIQGDARVTQKLIKF